MPGGGRPFLQQGPQLFAFWGVLMNRSLEGDDLFLPRAPCTCANGDPTHLWSSQPAPSPYLARCGPPVSPRGLCAPRPVVATAPRRPGAPELLPRPLGPQGRLLQLRGLAGLPAAALSLRAARSVGVPTVVALAGRDRRLSHSPHVDFALSGQLWDAKGLPGMRGRRRRDPERRWRLLRKVAEQEPLPRHVERQRLGRTPLGHRPGRLGRKPPSAGGRAPIAAEDGAERAREGEGSRGEGVAGRLEGSLEGAGRPASPRAAGAVLAAADVRPDVGE